MTASREHQGPWQATVVTLFPEMFPGPLGLSLAGPQAIGTAAACSKVRLAGFSASTSSLAQVYSAKHAPGETSPKTSSPARKRVTFSPTVAVVPALVVYALAQRHIIRGLTAGAIKQ